MNGKGEKNFFSDKLAFPKKRISSKRFATGQCHDHFLLSLHCNDYSMRKKQNFFEWVLFVYTARNKTRPSRLLWFLGAQHSINFCMGFLKFFDSRKYAHHRWWKIVHHSSIWLFSERISILSFQQRRVTRTLVDPNNDIFVKPDKSIIEDKWWTGDGGDVGNVKEKNQTKFRNREKERHMELKQILIERGREGGV